MDTARWVHTDSDVNATWALTADVCERRAWPDLSRSDSMRCLRSWTLGSLAIASRMGTRPVPQTQIDGNAVDTYGDIRATDWATARAWRVASTVTRSVQVMLPRGKWTAESVNTSDGSDAQVVQGAPVQTAESPAAILYGASWAPEAADATAYLMNKGLAFEYHDIDKEPRLLEEMLGKVQRAPAANALPGKSSSRAYAGQTVVLPVIDFGGGTVLVGFDQAQIDAAVAARPSDTTGAIPLILAVVGVVAVAAVAIVVAYRGFDVIDAELRRNAAAREVARAQVAAFDIINQHLAREAAAGGHPLPWSDAEMAIVRQVDAAQRVVLDLAKRPLPSPFPGADRAAERVGEGLKTGVEVIALAGAAAGVWWFTSGSRSTA